MGKDRHDVTRHQAGAGPLSVSPQPLAARRQVPFCGRRVTSSALYPFHGRHLLSMIFRAEILTHYGVHSPGCPLPPAALLGDSRPKSCGGLHCPSGLMDDRWQTQQGEKLMECQHHGSLRAEPPRQGCTPAPGDDAHVCPRIAVTRQPQFPLQPGDSSAQSTSMFSKSRWNSHNIKGTIMFVQFGGI